jgi:hypothetical protein
MAEYPILLDGKNAGKLLVTDQGSALLFDAVCPGTSALIRLSAYGGGREFYLGVMQPEGSSLRLRRTVRRRELPFPPEELTHAGRQGELPKRRMPPEETLPAECDTLWHADILGLLWTEERGSTLCAIPTRLGMARAGEERPGRTIGGVRYRIFKIGKTNRP